MAYEVEVSDEFKAWYENLSEPEQNSVERVVLMLMEAGPSLGYPQSTGIKDKEIQPHAGVENPARRAAISRPLRLRSYPCGIAAARGR